MGPFCTGQMLRELNCFCLMTCDESTKRESTDNLTTSTHLHVRIATKTFICLMGATLKGTGSKRTACKCKQNFDTHRKHILDMAIGTSKVSSVQLTESIITGSISAKLSVQACRYGCDAKLQEHINSLTRIHSKPDIVVLCCCASTFLSSQGFSLCLGESFWQSLLHCDAMHPQRPLDCQHDTGL